MRSVQVAMLMLCLLGGLYLLTQAPVFFLPSRDPSIGLQFDNTAARMLGAGLLALAAVGMQYMRAMYYSEVRNLPDAAGQRRYFALLMTALVLIVSALLTAEPGDNPEYRQPSANAAP